MASLPLTPQAWAWTREFHLEALVLGLALESPVDPGAPARDPRPRAFLGAMEPVWASCFSWGSLCSDSCHGPSHTQTGWMGGVPNPSVSPWVNSP